MADAEPPRGCLRCPRLVAYRSSNATRHPDWFNGAVPSDGDPAGRLLVVGLAPGVAGANRTGRPFSGDGSGDLLHATLARFGFSSPDPAAAAPILRDCMITNAVRCAPPQNRPTAGECAACRPYLAARIAALPRLRAIVCLGRIAHDSLIRCLGMRAAAHGFAHGARHEIGRVAVFDSYHCSRYNMQTGRLTAEKFAAVFAAVRSRLSTFDA